MSLLSFSPLIFSLEDMDSFQQVKLFLVALEVQNQHLGRGQGSNPRNYQLRYASVLEQF